MARLLTKREAMNIPLPCDVYLEELYGGDQTSFVEGNNGIDKLPLRKTTAVKKDDYRMYFTDGRYSWNAYGRPYMSWRIWLGRPDPCDAPLHSWR